MSNFRSSWLYRRHLLRLAGVVGAYISLSSASDLANLVWADDSSLTTGDEAKVSNKDIESSMFATRVKSIVEVRGKVILRSDENSAKAIALGDAIRPSIESKSTLEYEEIFDRGKSTDSSFHGIVQFFSQAESENLINKHATALKLREECKTIVRDRNDVSIVSCLDNPLTLPERDLVQGVFSTAHLDSLLPGKPIKLGDQWELAGPQLARFLQIDQVIKGTLTITLIEADKKIGQLEVRGSVEGKVRDVNTQIIVDGKARVDRTVGMVDWVAMNCDEKRERSEREPGCDITSRVRIVREKIDTPTQEISLKAVRQLLDDPATRSLALYYSRLGAYKFVADENWTLYTDSGIDATLRWVIKNYTFAQCSIINLTDTDPGTQLTLEAFQEDIRRTLGKQFGQMIEANERVTSQQLRMMRVVTIGTHDQAPMQWIHVLLSNDAGRHLSLVFTMNPAAIDKFAEQDLQVADTLTFTLRQLPTLPDESEKKQVDSKAAETATKPSTKR